MASIPSKKECAIYRYLLSYLAHLFLVCPIRTRRGEIPASAPPFDRDHRPLNASSSGVPALSFRVKRLGDFPRSIFPSSHRGRVDSSRGPTLSFRLVVILHGGCISDLVVSLLSLTQCHLEAKPPPPSRRALTIREIANPGCLRTDSHGIRANGASNASRLTTSTSDAPSRVVRAISTATRAQASASHIDITPQPADSPERTLTGFCEQVGLGDWPYGEACGLVWPRRDPRGSNTGSAWPVLSGNTIVRPFEAAPQEYTQGVGLPRSHRALCP